MQRAAPAGDIQEGNDLNIHEAKPAADWEQQPASVTAAQHQALSAEASQQECVVSVTIDANHADNRASALALQAAPVMSAHGLEQKQEHIEAADVSVMSTAEQERAREEMQPVLQSSGSSEPALKKRKTTEL